MDLEKQRCVLEIQRCVLGKRRRVLRKQRRVFGWIGLVSPREERGQASGACLGV